MTNPSFPKMPYAQFLSEEHKEYMQKLVGDDLSDDALWKLIGTSIVGQGATGEDPTPEGKQAINQMLARLKKAICNDPRIDGFINNDSAGDALAIALVFTAKLAAEAFEGFDLCALCLLIARIGLREFCASERLG